MRKNRWRGPASKYIRKAEETNFRPNVTFFTSLSTAEALVSGVKFSKLYGTVELLYGTL